MHQCPDTGGLASHSFGIPRLTYPQTFSNILIPDMIHMHNVEVIDKLLDSQKDNADPQQQAVSDLLRRMVKFAAQVKASQSQLFVAIENQFRVAADGWAVPSKANEIGTMAYGVDPGLKGKTQVYYIVCHRR